MHTMNRRSLLTGMTSLTLTAIAASASQNDPKVEFMKGAINHIKEASRPRGERWPALERLCIPVPFADFDFYYTWGELRWAPNPGQSFERVTVPEGFCTDLTSVPRAFWSAFPPTGRCAYAAIVHDYLYWVQTRRREDADQILSTAMKDSQVSDLTINLIYSSVRAGGGSSWDGNAAAKKTGEKRFLKVFPEEGRLVSWVDWRKDPAHFSD